jgi:hypothetical protein
MFAYVLGASGMWRGNQASKPSPWIFENIKIEEKNKVYQISVI